MKKTVLVFVVDKETNSLLMIFKKRGQGEGKWNVPGGKISPGESAEAAAVRETIEETGIQVSSLRVAGQLDFLFPKKNGWDNSSTVFITTTFSGKVIPETEECSASWIPIERIPYDKMWDDDHLWFPLVFSGQFFQRRYSFDENNEMSQEEITR